MSSPGAALQSATDTSAAMAGTSPAAGTGDTPCALPEPVEDFLPLRTRLGRMLGRPKPLTDVELHQANLALTQLLEAPDAAQYLQQHRPILPPATHPLLLTLLAGAWADADTGLACALEILHRHLVQPPRPNPLP